MNRQETVKWLKSLKTVIGKSEHGDLQHHAKSIDMAIKALTADAVQGGDAEVRDDRTYINEPYMQQGRHDDGRMTREQAVKWVKFVHDVLYEDKDEEIREALNMAIEALQKSIPKPPKKDNEDNLLCPLCGEDVDWHKYCEECGQAIEW